MGTQDKTADPQTPSVKNWHLIGLGKALFNHVLGALNHEAPQSPPSSAISAKPILANVQQPQGRQLAHATTQDQELRVIPVQKLNQSVPNPPLHHASQLSQRTFIRAHPTNSELAVEDTNRVTGFTPPVPPKQAQAHQLQKSPNSNVRTQHVMTAQPLTLDRGR